MEGRTLLVRHLPLSLTKEEKEDFLLHFGAVGVHVNGTRGPMKHTAFAEFPSRDVALQVLSKLHQVEVLGCKLVVELLKDRTISSLANSADASRGKSKQEAGVSSEKPDDEKEENGPEENAFDTTFLQWGLKYPRRRRLFYSYPPPSPSILANISHALAACPKFYVQVLHLMNKMDLPAPFGPVTAQPPLASDQQNAVNTADILETAEMEVSSTEESELESDTEALVPRPSGEASAKRKQPDTERQLKKRARLAMAMFQQHVSGVRPSVPAASLREVFDQVVDSSSQRKIELRIPSSVVESSNVQTQASDHLTADSGVDTSISEAQEQLETGGFGLITPAPKVSQEGEKQGAEEGWYKTKFISGLELREGRLSQREMEKVNVFKSYQEGEPSRRVYIKNLAKQVTEQDLHWMFGRYVDWDDEAQKDIFDIRLMKEGRMKGQAFVTLATEEQAAKAVRDTNAFVLKGKPMVVFARSARPQQEGQ